MNICLGNNPINTWYNVPGIYNGFNGWTPSVANPTTVGMFVYPNVGTSQLHMLQFNAVTNKYTMSETNVTITGPIDATLGPVQIMTMFCDNRGGGGTFWYFQAPLQVVIAMAPGVFRTYYINFNMNGANSRVSCWGSSLTIDARLVNYQQFSPLTFPIYQNPGSPSIQSPNTNIPMQISSITWV
jgi:hypothetical protein